MIKFSLSHMSKLIKVTCKYLCEFTLTNALVPNEGINLSKGMSLTDLNFAGINNQEVFECECPKFKKGDDAVTTCTSEDVLCFEHERENSRN